jgi:glutaredoxin 3
MMLTVYSKEMCPYCTNAKRFLTQHGIPYQERRVDLDTDNLKFIRDRGHRTVPQIYLGDELFVEGGWDGLKTQDPAQLRLRMGMTDLGYL